VLRTTQHTNSPRWSHLSISSIGKMKTMNWIAETGSPTLSNITNAQQQTNGETKCDDFLWSWHRFLPRRAFLAWQRQQGPRHIQSASLPMHSSAITRTLSNAGLPRPVAWAIALRTLDTLPVRTRAIAALVSAFTNRQGSGDPRPPRIDCAGSRHDLVGAERHVRCARRDSNDR
jgi:hypothetical protein